MRLHRTPTAGMSHGVATGTHASSPSSTSTATLSRDSSYASMRGTPASANHDTGSKRGHSRGDSTASVLSAHGAHFHVRHATNSSIASADGAAAPANLQQEYLHAKDVSAAYKSQGDGGVSQASAQAHLANGVRPGSYATQAYREFLASNGASAATSAASSAAPSRQVSRGPSGYTSQATSGQSSRATSPVSKRDDEASYEQARTVAPHGGHNHARTSSGGSTHYVDALAYPVNHHTTTTTTTTTVQQVSTLSFGNLMLAKSDSQESLEDARYQMQPKYRPNHFTFSSDDIMKSFLRAAERDRARAEREAERQREAQQRLELEQEYERRKAAQRDMAYAAQVQAAHAYRADTVGADLSTDASSEEDAAPTRRRRRFPPIPAHFKFSSHDVAKSASKLSQRQNIGHWTTFPRSSTVVIAATQLRAWIQSLVEAQAAERAAARQLAASASRKQLSAPNSPVGGSAARKADVGTSTSRAHHHRASGVSTSRRASVPHAIVQSETSTRARPTHSRSATLSSYEKEKLTEKLGGFSFGGEKASARYAGTHESAVEKSILLRRSGSGGGATGIMAQHQRPGASNAEQPRYEQQHGASGGIASSTARRSSLPVKALPAGGAGYVASVAAGALDASARRAAVLAARQQSLTAGAVLNGYVASAPGSTNHSPTRPVQNGRLVKSTHVSPTRHQRIVHGAAAGVIKSSLPPVQSAGAGATYSPMPPGQRKASLGGGVESKSASASNSPAMPAHSLLGASGLNESGWAHQAGQYEKTLLDVYQQVAHGQAQLQPPPPQPHHTKSTASLASLYRDVPSSGYGQTTTRGTRLV